MEKVSHANTKHKKPGKAVLITDKIDFKTEFYWREGGKERPFVVIKGPVYLEDISMNMYLLNNKVSKYVKQQITYTWPRVVSPKSVWLF